MLNMIVENNAHSYAPLSKNTSSKSKARLGTSKGQ